MNKVKQANKKYRQETNVPRGHWRDDKIRPRSQPLCLRGWILSPGLAEFNSEQKVHITYANEQSSIHAVTRAEMSRHIQTWPRVVSDTTLGHVRIIQHDILSETGLITTSHDPPKRKKLYNDDRSCDMSLIAGRRSTRKMSTGGLCGKNAWINATLLHNRVTTVNFRICARKCFCMKPSTSHGLISCARPTIGFPEVF